MKRRKRGSMSKAMLLFFGMLVTALAIGAMWAPDKRNEEGAENRPAPVRVSESMDPVTAGQRYSVSIPFEESEKDDSGDLWKAFAEAFRVERVAPEEDARLKERSASKQAFHQMRGILNELEEQGLTGEALYEAAASRLYETGDEGALKMLEANRRLEEDLAKADLDSMDPEDRFDYLVRARREAFGEETAEQLFFEKEAYSQYKLEEKAILEDTDLTETEKEAEIMGRRNALQVELASRGGYVSFADERSKELDRRLRERYGEAAVETMSKEERGAAVWDMYREELPPELLAKAEKVLAAQAQKRAAFEAYRERSEAILNDEDLNFEQKQELLDELSAEYNAGG